jgi:thiol-disulfide isomerase/thioredoxin
MVNGRLTRRAWTFIGLAAIAGVLAGTVAVYVNQSRKGNEAAIALAHCAGALDAAKRVGPLATGEVAAFRAAEAPDLLTDLSFKGADDGTVTLADFAGKTVLLNLWATWCVPCRAEMPALDRLQGALGGPDFTVVAVNVDVRDAQRAHAFLDEIGVKQLAFYADPSYKILTDLKQRGLAFGLPTTLLVDGKGCRIGVIQGPAAWDSDDAKALVRAAIG